MCLYMSPEHGSTTPNDTFNLYTYSMHTIKSSLHGSAHAAPMNSVGNEPLLCFPNLLLSRLADCLFESKLAFGMLVSRQESFACMVQLSIIQQYNAAPLAICTGLAGLASRSKLDFV